MGTELGKSAQRGQRSCQKQDVILMGDAFPGMTPPFFRVKLDPSAVQKSEPEGDCEDRNSHLKGLPSLGNYELLFPGDFSHQRQIQV